MIQALSNVTVAVCDTQPVAVEGVKAVLAEARSEFVFVGAGQSLQAAFELARSRRPALLLLDKDFGLHLLAQWLPELRAASPGTHVVIWGTSIVESEALRFIQTGARGVIRKSAEIESLLGCLRTAASGTAWMEDGIFRESSRSVRHAGSGLTPREQQVFQLVEQGLKNVEIARELGIRPGTVKIHLKHIFEKTGIRGRYGLALSGLKAKGLLTLTA